MFCLFDPILVELFPQVKKNKNLTKQMVTRHAGRIPLCCGVYCTSCHQS